MQNHKTFLGNVQMIGPKVYRLAKEGKHGRELFGPVFQREQGEAYRNEMLRAGFDVTLVNTKAK